MKKKFYTTQEVCKILNIVKKTLFLWEERGKIPKATRDPLFNYRIYTKEDIEKLKKIAETKWERRKQNEQPKKKN